MTRAGLRADGLLDRRALGQRAAWMAATAVASLMLVTGCSGPAVSFDENSTPHYAAEFELARQEATSDFERQVLEDSVITRDEYREAMSRYVSCVGSHDLQAALRDDGSGIFMVDVTGSWNSEVVDAAMIDCQVGTSQVIEPLYVSILRSPEKQDLDELTAECLVAVGLVSAPFSGRDYVRESASRGSTARVMDDPDGVRCMQNPSYHTSSG